MRLSKTPAALGFEDAKKGYFPHLFNTSENDNYIGLYPDPCFYGYDNMSDTERCHFMQWYNTGCDGAFDFQFIYFVNMESMMLLFYVKHA